MITKAGQKMPKEFKVGPLKDMVPAYQQALEELKSVLERERFGGRASQPSNQPDEQESLVSILREQAKRNWIHASNNGYLKMSK